MVKYSINGASMLSILCVHHWWFHAYPQYTVRSKFDILATNIEYLTMDIQLLQLEYHLTINPFI